MKETIVQIVEKSKSQKSILRYLMIAQSNDKQLN